MDKQRCSFWIGGATTWGGTPARGLRSLTLDGDKATLSDPTWVGENPAFVAQSAGLPLTVSHETDPGTLSAFASPESLVAGREKSDEEQQDQSTITRADTGSDGPTYIAIAHFPSGQDVVLAANYSGGALSVNPLSQAGIQGPSLVVQYQGSGPDKKRQASPHPHQVVVVEDLQVALVPDLGMDCIHVHKLSDLEAGRPDHKNILLPPGSGPRHLVVSGSVAIVACELEGLVRVVSIENGSPITDAVPWGKGLDPLENLPSAIALTRGGHVLVGNRGPDSIGVLKWDPLVETLTYQGQFPAGGSHPRDFHLSPDQQTLVVANLDGNNLAVFDFDDYAGILELRQTLPTGSPTCVVPAAN